MILRPPALSPAGGRSFPALALALGLAIVLAGCGKKGPPLPPIRVVPAATGPISVRQIGRDVAVTADLPGVRSDGTPVAPGSAVRVLRLDPGEGLRAGTVSDRYLVQQFQRQAVEVAKLQDDALRSHVVGGRLLYVDRNPAGAATGPRRFLYSLEVVDTKGTASPPRPPSEVEWVVPPPAPVGLKAEVAEGEVRLTWTPGEPGPGEKAASSPLYAVYRREASSPRESESAVHPGRIPETSFVDRTFRYDVDYVYTVRAVTSDAAGASESASAEPIAVRPHDSFAPATPSGLAVAVEGESVKVYWFPNTEPDLEGYRVYRREDGGGEPALAGQVPASETSWVDPEAAPGVRYHYSVSAYDAASPANESPRSEERSERRLGAPRAPSVTPPKPGRRST